MFSLKFVGNHKYPDIMIKIQISQPNALTKSQKNKKTKEKKWPRIQHWWSYPFIQNAVNSNPQAQSIVYNYSPKGRWIVVDIYRDAKRRGI